MNRAPRLSLGHYFWLEGLHGGCFVLFLYGAFFWTKQKFGFSDTQNLLLSATHGLVYIGASLWGGKLGDRLGYDRILFAGFLGAGWVLVTGWIPSGIWVPFAVVALYTLFVGPSWPVLEAALLHAPGKTSLPDRLGFYNVTWAFGDAVGLFVSGFLFAWRPDSILWVAGLVHFFQAAWLRMASPAVLDSGVVAMEMPHRGDDVPRETKRWFMHMSWLGNSLAFLMLAGFSALTPFIGKRLGLAPEKALWLASTLLFARGFGFTLFWKWEGWHYRMGWLVTVLWLTPAALAVVFFATNVAVVFGALIVFGFAASLTYSASLYYSMDYGENKGEHGGLHESMVGIGILVGPLLAAGVSSLGGGALGAQWTILILAVLVMGAGGRWIGSNPARGILKES